MIKRNAFRAACLFAVLLAGSCAGQSDDHPNLPQDGAANHPITVEPSYRSLKIVYAGTLSAEDTAKLNVFVGDYLAHGNGAISVSAPAGPDSQQTIAALGELLAGMGVPRSRILVGVQDQDGSDGRVELGYISYQAHTKPCGDWSKDVADDDSNEPMPNFGCAVQQNIAAQVADPRDLIETPPMSPADATRRAQVLSKYEQGQQTGVQKSKDQSGAVSDVGSQ